MTELVSQLVSQSASQSATRSVKSKLTCSGESCHDAADHTVDFNETCADQEKRKCMKEHPSVTDSHNPKDTTAGLCQWLLLALALEAGYQ